MRDEAPFRTYVPFLIYLSAIFYLTFLARIFLSPLLPTIESNLNIGHAEAGSLFFFISAGYFPGLLGSGYVSSRLTHRWTVILSSVVLGGSFFAVSLSYSLLWIRLGLIMLGLSSGLYFPSAMATLTDVVGTKHWGKAIAFHELAPILAFITAPLLAEGLMIWFSWRGVVAVLGLAALVAAGIFTLFGRGGTFFGETPSPKNLRVFLGRPSFWIMAVLFSISMGASIGVYSILPLYLVVEEGLKRTLANTLVAVSRVGGLGAIYLAGWAADRLGPRRIMGGAFLAAGIATILLGSLHGRWIIPPLFLQPLLISCSFPAALAALSKIGPPQARNVLVSLTMAISYVAAAGGIPAGIGILGDHGLFPLGFISVGILLMGCTILLRYLKFHQNG
ncbi:MAG: MFS transporter [Deltaproteobacteria bacterium]|nr:MFS transporter [Deltaproteobacteria bacterium]